MNGVRAKTNFKIKITALSAHLHKWYKWYEWYLLYHWIRRVMLSNGVKFFNRRKDVTIENVNFASFSYFRYNIDCSSEVTASASPIGTITVTNLPFLTLGFLNP